MSYSTSLLHPRYRATRVTVWCIDGQTALISDDEQKVRRGREMVLVTSVPDLYPQRWWVDASTLGHVQACDVPTTRIS